jgi:hypothetical protein
MNGFIRGALGLALAATAGLALAQPYGPPLAGGPPEHGMMQGPQPGQMHDRMHAPQVRDDMPGPDRRVGPNLRPDDRRAPYDAYGFDRMGLTVDGYDRYGYDAHGYDRYGFDPDGYSRDGYDRYGYDENGLDRYGRRAPAYRAEAGNDGREFSARRDHGDRDDRRAGPLGGYDTQAYGRSHGYESYSERDYGPDRAYGGDRYGPPRDDRRAYDPEVPSYGGAMQHFADPRCDTCRPAAIRPDCGCREHYGYETSSVSVNPAFFYGAGGVGPIPDGGYYGGGGYVVSGAGAHASSSAYASSSSRVSVSVRSGGGHHGGCNSCGGHR